MNYVNLNRKFHVIIQPQTLKILADYSDKYLVETVAREHFYIPKGALEPNPCFDCARADRCAIKKIEENCRYYEQEQK